MTVFAIITMAALILEVLILRFADSKRARKLVFDAFLVIFAVIWSVYEILQIHFTVQMLVAAIILGLGLAAIINFIRDLLK